MSETSIIQINHFFLYFIDVQNMSAMNAQPKGNSLQTTLQNLAKKRTTSIDTEDIVSSTRNHHLQQQNKDENWEGSLHSYHAWLKEKQQQEADKKNATTVSSTTLTPTTSSKYTPTTPTTTATPTTPGSSIKDEDEEEDEVRADDTSYQVDDIMERGPSPPENNEGSNSYEWSYEEQFKQVSICSLNFSNHHLCLSNLF